MLKQVIIKVRSSEREDKVNLMVRLILLTIRTRKCLIPGIIANALGPPKGALIAQTLHKVRSINKLTKLRPQSKRITKERPKGCVGTQNIKALALTLSIASGD
ncbi:MAG: hypothetical protein ACTS41_01015 [Candidatus Hodgkinia cicadicola]